MIFKEWLLLLVYLFDISTNNLRKHGEQVQAQDSFKQGLKNTVIMKFDIPELHCLLYYQFTLLFTLDPILLEEFHYDKGTPFLLLVTSSCLNRTLCWAKKNLVHQI